MAESPKCFTSAQNTHANGSWKICQNAASVLAAAFRATDDPSSFRAWSGYPYIRIWRLRGLSVNHGFARENACINGLRVIDIQQWTMPKLTSPLCIVKVKTSRGQNDMNKSIFAPLSSLSDRGENCKSILRGHETSAYFYFVPWPLSDTEGHSKRHFSRIIMDQRGILRPTLICLFESRWRRRL